MPITTPAATIGAGLFTQDAAHQVSSWINGGGAEDLWSKATPTWYLAWAKAKRKPLGASNTVRLADQRGVEPTPFDGYDTVGTMTNRAGVAASFAPANYSMPMSFSFTDELNYSGPHAIGDWYEEIVQTSVLTLGQTLARDMFRGNRLETKRMVGLEQLYAVYDQTTLAARIIDSWRARRQTNTYGGITRVAFTDDDVGGTGWEALTASYNVDPAMKFRLATAAPYPHDLGLEVLNDLIIHSTYGTTRPQYLCCTLKPITDYASAVATKSTFYRSGKELMSGDIGVSSVSFQGIPMYYDEFAKTWDTGTGTGSGMAAGGNNVYALNFDNMGIFVDPRADLALTSPRVPFNQHSSVKFLLLRLMHYCKNPRAGGFRIGAYPTT